jgi:hypothetical protein
VPKYLVERYRPGVTSTDVAAVIARDVEVAAEMRGEGRAIHILSSTFVEDDEVLLSVLEASSEDDVHALGDRSGTSVDRVIRALDVLQERASTGEEA